jgi:hypothetical protein
MFRLLLLLLLLLLVIYLAVFIKFGIGVYTKCSQANVNFVCIVLSTNFIFQSQLISSQLPKHDSSHKKIDTCYEIDFIRINMLY